ncbi:MAG: YabP/YqfC family sporulation protein [Clostridia bacterium]|nr:YabP/YqfC family sporulation protein [Clostridia bacterium]
MFNFFDELKGKVALKDDALSQFNIVNISGSLLYVEGHKGVTVLTEEMVAFKVKKGRVVVEGSGLTLAELSENTMLLQGKIKKVEQF